MMKKTDFTDTSIGNIGDEQSQSMHGGGKTHPGACFPFGMVQLSPDTVTGGDNGSGYNYCDSTIEGFSFNHLSGIGWWGDLGNIQVMPVINKTDLRSGSNEFFPLKSGKNGWRSEFSHSSEVTKAGFYSVFLEKYRIKAEATVTCHTGFLKFTYPESENAKIIFNLSRRIGGKADEEYVKIIDNTHLEGYVKCSPKGGGFGHGAGNISYTVYFYSELSKPLESVKFFSDERFCDAENEFRGEDIGCILEFKTVENDEIILKTAISYVDSAGAKSNFMNEAANLTFSDAENLAKSEWEKALSIIDIETDNETDKTLFYTCLYHTLLDPRTAVDFDGRYMGADKKAHKTERFTYRTCFSGWDVYRSEFPLLSLISPEAVNDEVSTLIDISESTSSAFPRWELMGIDSHCMVGDPALIVISDAVIKNIKNYDLEKAYEIGRASILGVNEIGKTQYKTNRENVEFMNKKGYHPKKLSDTLEELLAEYCFSRFAKALNNPDDEKLFYEHSKRVFENYNKTRGFMAPRKENGKFIFIKSKYDHNGCVESNIFQQSWFVPQDINGLIELFGEKRFRKLLEKLFKKADFSSLWNENYNHSNEPCHNITHYFNFLGCPERTQYWTRRIQKEAYKKGAYGFCGNEDVGQLSAWYVLSAIGFAQVCPAVPEYQINSPLFKKSILKLNEKYHSRKIADTLVIECDKDPLENPLIDEIYLNNKKLDRTFITYEELTDGGTLLFKMK